ncbi:DUF916 and DUF3324 domain-containing protein [Enterococcus sp. BWM-S5]|uniref:DUF916 and DUF3324 domain-containing protein n=1 Tax=Enterococcus larvae TaxID=2794352 RepID=A0ABS4CL62_9ENTE|nr:DUF916 and DUF3324 domain-containing protein [Enterococcus larvae]MBP1046524.1 DUF916 and DUF3324 domain-containing protein [Enterococcus larvae]
MKKWPVLLFIMSLYIVGLGCIAAPTYAEETTGQEESGAGPLGFNYKVIQPENQQNTQVGYFDLRMEPGQNQTVQIELSNDSDADTEVMVSLNGIKTNGNGVLEYGPSAIDNDKSLKYDFVDIVQGPESVIVPTMGTAIVDLVISMPEASYDGMISGGIQLKKKVDEEAREKETGVINEYAFMIGMVLTETDTVVEPELELNSVYAGLNNYRNSVFVNFSNVEAAYLNDLTVEVQIMGKDSDTVIYDTKKASMRIGPNNMIDFPVSMNGEKMVPGDYRAKILAVSGERKWEWEQEFTISDEEADKYNTQDVELIQEQGINWLLVGIVVGGMLLVVLIIFIVVRIANKKKHKKIKKKKAPKRKKTQEN